MTKICSNHEKFIASIHRHVSIMLASTLAREGSML